MNSVLFGPTIEIPLTDKGAPDKFIGSPEVFVTVTVFGALKVPLA
jgi:hypothetical protein